LPEKKRLNGRENPKKRVLPVNPGKKSEKKKGKLAQEESPPMEKMLPVGKERGQGKDSLGTGTVQKPRGGEKGWKDCFSIKNVGQANE